MPRNFRLDLYTALLWIRVLCRERFLHIKSKGVERVGCLRGRCIRLFAPTAGVNARFPLSLTQTGLFTAGTAGLRGEGRGGDTRFKPA